MPRPPLAAAPLAAAAAAGAAAVAGAAVSLSFEPPTLVSTGLGVYADAGYALAAGPPPPLIFQASPSVPGFPPLLATADGGVTWAPPAASCAGAHLVGIPLAAAGGGRRDWGTVTSVPDIYAHYTTFTTPNTTVFAPPPAGAAAGAPPPPPVSCVTSAAPVTFSGLPRPVTCAHDYGGCPFRLDGADVVRLPDRSFLATAIVKWAGGDPWAVSIVAFSSADGASWAYLSTVADAHAFPASQEGPNEHALALLSDNATVLVVIRLDAGDGPATHPYVNYVSATSADGGRTWSPAAAIPNAGCARPRLLHLGYDPVFGGTAPAPAVLTGGRWRNHGTTDILLWTNEDGMGGAGEWAGPTSISYWHNALAPNASWRFSPHVNSTSEPRETTSYTSIVPLDSGFLGGAGGARSRRLGLMYNRLPVGAPLSDGFTFLMPFTVSWV
jgi:hypothetical protein